MWYCVIYDKTHDNYNECDNFQILLMKNLTIKSFVMKYDRPFVMKYDKSFVMKYDKPSVMRFDRSIATQIHDFEWLKTFNSQYLNASSTNLLRFCAVEFLSLGATIMFIWMFIILLYKCVYSMYSTAWIKMKFDD